MLRFRRLSGLVIASSLLSLVLVRAQNSTLEPLRPTQLQEPVLATNPATVRSPIIPPTAVPVAVKWTLANLRKEEVTLFEMVSDGKMAFRQKVPPGEAVDLTSSGPNRWIAFSTTGPSADWFEPKADAVWLLRSVVPPAPLVPPAPGPAPPYPGNARQPIPADPT